MSRNAKGGNYLYLIVFALDFCFFCELVWFRFFYFPELFNVHLKLPSTVFLLVTVKVVFKLNLFTPASSYFLRFFVMFIDKFNGKAFCCHRERFLLPVFEGCKIVFETIKEGAPEGFRGLDAPWMDGWMEVTSVFIVMGFYLCLWCWLHGAQQQRISHLSIKFWSRVKPVTF